MAEKKKDDVAAALEALAQGQVPSEHETPSGGIPSESTVFTPSPAEAPPPAAVRPIAPPPPRPAAPPASLTPARTGITSQTPPPARVRPAAPQRPSVPVAPVRPVVEEAPPPPQEDQALSQIVMDDDTMDAPAVDLSTLRRTPVAKKKPASPVFAQLKFRQTMIPLLLTNGVLLPGIGAWALLWKDSFLHDAGKTLPVLLISVGALLLITGVLNALHIKSLLAKGT